MRRRPAAGTSSESGLRVQPFLARSPGTTGAARQTPASSSSGDHVTLSIATFDLILDTIERARSGVEHALRILESGAQAFNREKANLDSASELISAIKRRR